MTTEIEPPEELVSGARFGTSVALGGDDLYIGELGNFRGSLHHYRFQGSTWTHASTLADESPRLGQSMALQADRLVVGEEGGVRIYDISDGTPVLTEHLQNEVTSFGSHVALDGDHLVVLAGDEAHAYAWSGEAWQLAQVLPVPSGSSRVVLHGNRLAGSQPLERNGVVWIFSHDGVSWLSEALLEPESGTRFGLGIDLDGDVLVVSKDAVGDRIEVHEHAEGDWTLREQFGQVSANPGFGTRLWLEGDLLFAAGYRTVAGDGYSVLWKREDDGVWLSQLSAPPASSIFKDGDRVVLGSPGFDGQRGLVTILELAGAWTGSPCMTSDDCIGGACVDGRCCESLCSGACDVCSVEAGGERDGVCTDLEGISCCTRDSHCGEDTHCLSFVCQDDNTCREDDLCCATDADCASGGSCPATCNEGRCTEPCEDPGSGSSTSATGSVSSGSGSGAPEMDGPAVIRAAVVRLQLARKKRPQC